MRESGIGAMKMDHALWLATGLTAQPDDIVSTAGRLTREAVPAGLPDQPRRRQDGAASAPDNHQTLLACRKLLAKTVSLLE
jgi:hypothetical protein